MTKLKIQPVGDRILVQRAAEKEQVRRGVIIPDNAREKPQEAQVLALGTGTKLKDGTVVPFEIKVGDTVLVGKFAGADVTLADERFTLIREDDILGIIA